MIYPYATLSDTTEVVHSVFFWSNENKPTEPIHIHISKHNPRAILMDLAEGILVKSFFS